MDNVIQHSGVEHGFVMGQHHKNTKHIAFTIFDLGQGIYNSFQNSNYQPRTHTDAITLSLQESVTRDKAIGQGNGLFGLSSIIKQSESRLRITSGKGYYSFQPGGDKTYPNIPIISNKVAATTIDFIIDYSKGLSLENALIFNGQLYVPTRLRIENMEDDMGRIRFNVRKKSYGTGTRQAAELIRNEIMNILLDEPKQIILDFSGISVISSSYSDELIAKLFCSLGLFQLNALIKIVGLSHEQQTILQKSVIQRITEDYGKEEL